MGAEVAVETADGKYMKAGVWYNEFGLRLSASLGKSGEIDFTNPENIDPAVRDIMEWLKIPLDRMAELAQKGFLRNMRYQSILMVQKALSGEGEMPDEGVLGTLGIDVDIAAGSVVLPGGVLVNYDTRVKLTVEDFTQLHMTPVVSIQAGMVEFLGTLRQAEAHLKFNRNSKYRFLVGGRFDATGISPSVGLEKMEESGIGTSLTFSPSLGFTYFSKKSEIHGDIQRGIRGGATGVKSFTFDNPGSLKVTEEGEIEAYNKVLTKEGVLFLFQYQTKPEAVKRDIREISRLLDPLLKEKRSVYFSENILGELGTEKNIIKFKEFLKSPGTQKLLENIQKKDSGRNVDSLIFQSLSEEEGNNYNPEKGDIYVANIKAPLPDYDKIKAQAAKETKKEKGISVPADVPPETQEVYRDLKDTLHRWRLEYGLKVIEAGTLQNSPKQVEGLLNLLKFLEEEIQDGDLFPEQFRNKQITFTEEGSWQSFFEELPFASWKSRPKEEAGATLNLSRNLLERFADNHMGDAETMSSKWLTGKEKGNAERFEALLHEQFSRTVETGKKELRLGIKKY